MEFNALTSNKFISKNSSFTCQSILIPHNNSKTITAYSTVSKGNLKYYSPIENSFFWGTGNGNLPCVNKEQLDYFEKYLLVYPQQRTTNLKDGFYAKK